jgi:hypothetical protein
MINMEHTLLIAVQISDKQRSPLVVNNMLLMLSKFLLMPEMVNVNSLSSPSIQVVLDHHGFLEIHGFDNIATSMV